jgi:hypothetical protein
VRSIRTPGTWGFVIALTLLAGSFVASSAAAAASKPISSGGIGVRLIAETSSSSAGQLGFAYVVERMAPGSSVTREVEISNTTDAVADVAVFPAAASIAEGKFSFAPGRSGDSLSTWTTVAHSVLHLAPGATVADRVSIDVPRKASSGERYAVVWAEVSAPSPTKRGVRLVNRVGVRMYVSVGKGGMPAAEFTVGSLAAGRTTNGAPLVTAVVHNVGQAALEITGELTLSNGPGGLSAGPFPVALGSLLAPNHSAIERIQLGNQIPRGPWRANLTLSSDGEQQSSVTAITFPARTFASGKGLPSGSRMLGALAVLMLVAAVASSILFSRRRSLRPA